MPAQKRSLAITDRYRRDLAGLVKHATYSVRKSWRQLDWANLDRSYVPIHSTAFLSITGAQRQAVNLTAGYMGAYLSSELGERQATPVIHPTEYVGRSFTDDDLGATLNSPLIKVKVANKDRQPDPMGTGLKAMLAAVDLDIKHAARKALRDFMERDDRIVGWRRAVRGTCGACAGAAEGSTLPAGTPLEIHPNCECVSEATVKGRPANELTPTKLSSNNANAMQRYVGTPRSLEINKYLRGLLEPGAPVEGLKADAAALDLAMREAGPLNSLVSAFRATEGLPEGVRVGEVFTERGFTSTTAYEDIVQVGDVFWDLTIDPRVRGVWGQNAEEGELVLERGCRYVIDEIREGEVMARILPPV